MNSGVVYFSPSQTTILFAFPGENQTCKLELLFLSKDILVQWKTKGCRVTPPSEVNAFKLERFLGLALCLGYSRDDFFDEVCHNIGLCGFETFFGSAHSSEMSLATSDMQKMIFKWACIVMFVGR